MDEVEAKQLLEYIPQKERDSYDAADFAGPDRSFPITTQGQLDAAAHLIGHAANPAAVKAKAKRIAKRKGFTLPKAWQDDEDDGDGKSSAHDQDGHRQGQHATAGKSQESAPNRPRQKIATVPVCFLEYNARSLNGRIYPRATCDAIYQSGLRKLADTNALPITVFISHEAANGNANTELVGAARRIWQEGSKFYAGLDFADTSTARDMLALVEGNYMRSISMRVVGVELLHDRNYDLPLVVPQEGIEPELVGIDLTTRPGLMDTARIQQVLYESNATPPFTEAFTLDSIHIEKGQPAIPLYIKVLAEGLTPDRAAHGRIHDHLAGVLDATVGSRHGSESARLRAAVESELTEEGRALAVKHARRLAMAHDESARQLGMDCNGAYNDALGIPVSPDRDGPNQSPHTDGEESRHRKDEAPMALTEQQIQEALAEISKRGYTVAPPKSKEEQLQEAFEAKLAERDRQWEERFKALAPAPATTQRQTQSLGALTEGGDPAFQPEHIYQEGDFLQGKLHPKNWKALANRRVPWPADVDPNQALFELAPFMEYTIMQAQEAARGRSLRDMIERGEVQ